jgi:hypothetical protein
MEIRSKTHRRLAGESDPQRTSLIAHGGVLMLEGSAADTASMGSSEGQRYAIAFARSDGRAPLSFLSTERAAFGPRKLAEKRADTE